MRLMLEWKVFIAGDESGERWRQSRLALETNVVKTRVNYTLHLISTICVTLRTSN